MDSIETSGKALVEHWKWAAEKGLMNTNTASAMRAACSQVLGVMDGWQTLDVRAVDVSEVCRRFQIKRSKDFKPESLDTYKKRFAQAVKQFLDYANDPSSWKTSSVERVSRRGRKSSIETTTAHDVPATPERATAASTTMISGLVEYPFPLREGRFAYLRLPVDLKISEVKRLTAYLMTLTIDSEPA